ncbi:MAG: BACON domain-containing protein [Chloroflexi bacterium]|nr:BACON domain-containing protein [Chloroflexota bacterium]
MRNSSLGSLVLRVPQLWLGLGLGLAAGLLALFLLQPSSACGCAVEDSQSYQPQFSEATAAFHEAGTNSLGPGYFSLPDIEAGYPNSTLVSPSIPCVLLKSVGYIESSWQQADRSVPRGQTGPTLVSWGCGYGIMQITSGMQNPTGPDGQPSDEQLRIAEDYKYNIGWGAQMLVGKWNVGDYWGAVVGNRSPQIAEDWYYAVWAYNYWGWKNNPNNLDYPWPRVPYDGSQDSSNYPYQELVWGRAANPPLVDGNSLWQPVALTLPPRESISDPPGHIDTPSPYHEFALRTRPLSLSFLTEPGVAPPPQTLKITSGDSGCSFSWTATPSASWLEVSPASGKSAPATVQISVDTSGLGEGFYNGTVTINAGEGVADSPQTISVSLWIASLQRIFLPNLNQSSSPP